MELLILAVDKRDLTDPDNDVIQPKRGDVIAACPDGWQWGSGELGNPKFRVVRVPGMTQDQADALMATEIRREIIPGKFSIPRRRAQKIDLDNPELVGMPHNVVSVVPLAKILAARKTKEPLDG